MKEIDEVLIPLVLKNKLRNQIIAHKKAFDDAEKASKAAINKMSLEKVKESLSKCDSEMFLVQHLDGVGENTKVDYRINLLPP